MIRLLLLTWILFSSFNAFSAPSIVIFGDSLSAEFGLQKNQGWVFLLNERLIRNGYQYRIINASISGETSGGGLRRLEKTLNKHQPEIIIIELGANDGLRGLSLTQLKNNLSRMVSLSLKKQAKPLLVGTQLPPNYGLRYTQKFSDIFNAVSKEHQVPLVPSLFKGFASNRQYFLSDQIHPNASAQKLILANIWPSLSELLR